MRPKSIALLCMLVMLFVACTTPEQLPEKPDNTQTIKPETSQPSISLSITPVSLSIPEEGKTESVSVTCNGDWTLSGTADWCTPSITSGSGNASVSFVVKANEGADSRSATFKFTCQDKSAELQVNQARKVFTLTVQPTSIGFLSAVGTRQIQITCNGDWTVSGLPEWCSLSPSSGTGDATVSLTVSNNGDSQRSAQLVFACHDKTANVAVNQSGGGWHNMRFVHKSLFMVFTSVFCGYSATMNRKIKSADAVIGDKYHRVDVYGRGGEGIDDMGDSPINFQDASRLERLYWTATPSGVLDFRIHIQNWVDEGAYTVPGVMISAINQQEELYPAATGVAFSSSLSGRTLSVKGTVYAHKAEKFKLTVYLLEDGVEMFSERHNDVLRLSLTDTLGDEFTMANANTTYDFQYGVDIPEGIDSSNLFLLVYVQRQYGSQTVVRDVYANDYYVDNCRKARVGEEAKLEIYEYASGGGNEGITVGGEITF